MEITLQFEIGQKVMIREVQRPGRVDMVQIDSIGVQFRVAYWIDGERKNTWLYFDELDAI